MSLLAYFIIFEMIIQFSVSERTTSSPDESNHPSNASKPEINCFTVYWKSELGGDYDPKEIFGQSMHDLADSNCIKFIQYSASDLRNASGVFVFYDEGICVASTNTPDPKVLKAYLFPWASCFHSSLIKEMDFIRLQLKELAKMHLQQIKPEELLNTEELEGNFCSLSDYRIPEGNCQPQFL